MQPKNSQHTINTQTAANEKAAACAPSALSAEDIRSCLWPAFAELPVFVHQTIDSTNAEALRMIAAGRHEPFLVTAEQQNAGRGRMGRGFHSPLGSSVYFTLSLGELPNLADAVSVTAMAAVACLRAISRCTKAKPLIKWVNDLYLDGKKICGILAEAQSQGSNHCLVVGIGININVQNFPAELAASATSLQEEQLNRNLLIAEICSELMQMLAEPGNKSYLQEYRQHSLVLGKEIVYNRAGQLFEATALDIDDEGGLLVRLADGTTDVLNHGEISLRLKQ